MRRRARERQEMREDRPILKRLRATLLLSFRGLHGKKMVCVRGVPGVTGTLWKANRHFDPTQTGRGPHHHVEAAVDWYSSILLALHLHTTYTTEISHFTIQKDSSQYVRWRDGAVVRASASQSVDQGVHSPCRVKPKDF